MSSPVDAQREAIAEPWPKKLRIVIFEVRSNG